MQVLFVERMSPQHRFWLLLVMSFFTSAALAENDGVGMVASFMTQLGALLERDDLRLLLVEDQPSNQKKPEDEEGDVFWKNTDGDEGDVGVLLRTLTAHIPCR